MQSFSNPRSEFAPEGRAQPVTRQYCLTPVRDDFGGCIFFRELVAWFRQLVAWLGHSRTPPSGRREWFPHLKCCDMTHCPAGTHRPARGRVLNDVSRSSAAVRGRQSLTELNGTCPQASVVPGRPHNLKGARIELIRNVHGDTRPNARLREYRLFGSAWRQPQRATAQQCV